MAVGLAGTAVSAQTAPTYSADIPAKITTPDSVDSRIGTLRFQNGAPDADTVKAVYDNLDFMRGVQAFLTGMSATSVRAMCNGLEGAGIKPNQGFGLTEDLMVARSLFLTPNTTTVYGFASLDLTAGPMVLTVPSGVLGPVDDAVRRRKLRVPRRVRTVARRAEPVLLLRHGYYATGITPAMAMAKPGSGSAYAGTFRDSTGAFLDGGKTYKVTLPGPVPAKEFWSFVVYDNQTRSLLETDQKLAGVDSTAKDLKVGSDGTVTVHFGPKAPEGEEANWVQTTPGKGFNVLFRLYGPLEPWFDKSWKPGDLEVVN
jgi:hypothetical protein